MLPDDDLLGPLRVLYLVHAFPPLEVGGPLSVAYECATNAANRGWTTTVVSADPAVTAWGDVRESRRPGEWFTRVAVPLTEPGPPTALASSATPDPKRPAVRCFEKILRRSMPDLLHVVDTVHLPPDWPDLAAELGIAVVRGPMAPDEMASRYAGTLREHLRARPVRSGVGRHLRRR